MCRASSFFPCCCHNRPRLTVARSSNDLPSCRRAISIAFRKHPSGDSASCIPSTTLRASPSPSALSNNSHLSHRLGQHPQPCLWLAHGLIGLGQQSQKIRPKKPLCPGGRGSSQTLAYLGNPRFALPLLGQRPASGDRSPSQPQSKSLFGTDRNGLFCSLLSDCPLLAKLVKPR